MVVVSDGNADCNEYTGLCGECESWISGFCFCCPVWSQRGIYLSVLQTQNLKGDDLLCGAVCAGAEDHSSGIYGSVCNSGCGWKYFVDE